MKYLNFEGLQYFYSKLSSSLAGKYVSQSNLKTINGQSLIGTGDITIEGGASGDYLPLSGGTMTGDIIYKSPNESVLCSIGTQGDVAHNNATGWIACDNIGSGYRTIIQGNGLRAYAQNSSETAQPYQIEYFYDNIYIYFHPDSSTTRKYKFNLQKLINDGYLIEE